MRANGAVQWLGEAEKMTQGVPSVSIIFIILIKFSIQIKSE